VDDECATLRLDNLQKLLDELRRWTTPIFERKPHMFDAGILKRLWIIADQLSSLALLLGLRMVALNYDFNLVVDKIWDKDIRCANRHSLRVYGLCPRTCHRQGFAL